MATDLHSILISIHYELGHVVETERAARTALAALDELTSPDVRAVAYWNANRILAEGRAKSVANKIQELGIAPERLHAIGMESGDSEEKPQVTFVLLQKP